MLRVGLNGGSHLWETKGRKGISAFYDVLLARRGDAFMIGLAAHPLSQILKETVAASPTLTVAPRSR